MQLCTGLQLSCSVKGWASIHLRHISRTADGRANATVLHIGNDDSSSALAAPLMAVGDLHGEALPSCLLRYTYLYSFWAMEIHNACLVTAMLVTRSLCASVGKNPLLMTAWQPILLRYFDARLARMLAADFLRSFRRLRISACETSSSS